MKKTIESIKSQTFKDFEVWILDGESDDDTQKFLRNLETPFFYKSEKDKGIYSAMNKGVSLSKGDWLYFLGAGDCFATHNILNIVFDRSEFNFDIIFGNVKYDKKEPNFFITKWSYLLWFKNTVHHQSIFYKKGIFKKHIYNTNYQILADYNLNLKLFSSKIEAFKIEQIVAICNSKGVSKKYTWQLYNEEVNLKIKNSSILFLPIFYTLAAFKFLFRKFSR